MNVIFLITQEDPQQTDVYSDNTTYSQATSYFYCLWWRYSNMKWIQKVSGVKAMICKSF